jgi:tetratricopeptide (TPR) repeat protein
MMTATAVDRTSGSSVARNASHDEAFLNLVRGEIELADGRAERAIPLFEAAAVLDPRSVDVLDSIAQALVAAGRDEDAVKQYEALVATSPLGFEGQELWLRAHVRVGELYERLGRPNDARKSYERLLTLWKDADSDVVALREARAHLAALMPGERRSR